MEKARGKSGHEEDLDHIVGQLEESEEGIGDSYGGVAEGARGHEEGLQHNIRQMGRGGEYKGIGVWTWMRGGGRQDMRRAFIIAHGQQREQ